MRTVFCSKLQKYLPGLSHPPYPGPVGEKIFEHISEAAWKEWLNHQTMLINENRLQVTQASARQFLREAMEQFLFGSMQT